MTFLVNDKIWPEKYSVPFLEVLESIREETNTDDIKTFIECGSGDTGYNAIQFSNFFNVISIENNPDLHNQYKNKKGTNHEIKWILGDGRENLKSTLLENPDERFLILLDDHNGYQSFIKEEMEIINSCSNRNDHIIIIDDMDEAGKGSYPTIKDLNTMTLDINKEYIIKNSGIGKDIYIIYTRSNK
tara:strand:+ start:34 stop:594 length:561 start_codon:yes stop_codon:yes gene_type:complete